MNKAIAILVCTAAFAIILMVTIAIADEASVAENLVSVNPAVHYSEALASSDRRCCEFQLHGEIAARIFNMAVLRH